LRRVSNEVAQCSILGPLLLLNCINDLEIYSFPVLFADDTSVVTTDTNSTNFLINSREIFSQLINDYLQRFLLNYSKTNFLHFRTKIHFLDTKLKYNNKSTDTKLDTRFLGIILDSTLQWKAHID